VPVSACPIWDIRYVEWRKDEYHVWLVDYDGIPILLQMKAAYEDPTFTPSHWVNCDPYRCAGCGQLFRSWSDVKDHIAPFEDTFQLHKLDDE